MAYLNGDMTVCVVIPTFNREERLSNAIRSVEKQTYQTDEIIVVDDGSDDGTDSMMNSMFPHVRYLRQENAGVSAARNVGIRASSADWFAFLDSDDEWLPEKLAKQMTAINATPETVVCHTDEIWIRNGKRVNPMKKHVKSGGWIFRRCLPLCTMSPSSIMIHRSVFDRIGLFDESLPACEDYDLWLRITSLHPVFYLDEPLIVKNGGHADQLSRKYWGMDRFRMSALKKILDRQLLKPDDEKAARAMLAEKAKIYLNGARKRNNQQEVAYYQALCQDYGY